MTSRLSDPTRVLLWTLLLLLLVTPSLPCSIRSHYTVSGQGLDTPICYTPSPPSRPCKTLHYLLTHVSSCANIVVLDKQTLTAPLNLTSNSTDLLIAGNSSGVTTVRCEGKSGLFFPSSHRVSIKNLNFIGCSMDISKLVPSDARKTIHTPLSSITFWEGEGVEIEGCVFSSSKGSALLMVDVKDATISESTFTVAKHTVDPAVRKSGGIVIRRLPHTLGNFSYAIADSNFTDNRAIPDTLLCSSSGYVSYYNDRDPYSGYGGAIDAVLHNHPNSTTHIDITGSMFVDNRALRGGAISVAFSGNNSVSTVSVVGSTFRSNEACVQGGAVLIFTDTFLPDHSPTSLGFLSIESSKFVENTAFWGGGVAMYRGLACGELLLSASNSTWDQNTALTSGYAVGIGGNRTSTQPTNPFEVTEFHSRVNITNCEFLSNNNTGLYKNINAAGALYVTASDLQFQGDNLFHSNSGTSLFLNGLTRATFAGNLTFRENFGIKGGAVYLITGSRVKLEPTASVLFADNKAMVSGGAVYSNPLHEDYGNPPIPCLFEFEGNDNDTLNITFEGNTAGNFDQAIFVGNPSVCDWDLLLRSFTYIPNIENQVFTVAENISLRTLPPKTENGTLRIMLGEEFSLDPLVTDEFGHHSTSFGYLVLLLADTYQDAGLWNFTLAGPVSIGADNFTKNNVFHITGPEDDPPELLIEFLYEQISSYRSGNALVRIEIIPCRVGYRYSEERQKCECAQDLEKNVICSTEGNVTGVCIRQGYWYDQETQSALPCPTTNCNYSNGKCPNNTIECPNSPGYCNITSADDVCWVGRGGYLCSQCKDGYGFSFGALGCSPDHTCRSRNTFLLLLAVFLYWFFFIGVLLVILASNDISVGSGFMYGLIYYFSVATLFTDVSIDNVFLRYLISACISMTQLDPRILVQFLPICFAKEMDDGLQHLMFRYVTPLFIICVLAAIVWLSRCRLCRLPKRLSLTQNSPIHAICILILFSYTSLSHTSFQILRPMVVNGSVRVAASPTVSYFNPRGHLPYALFALAVEFLISLPICFLLLFAPCLSKKVNLVKLRLLPILDEFQACYRPEHRWFAGYYFLARQLMYLANIVPQQDLPQINMLLVFFSVVILLVHASFQPYKRWWLNVIDTIFLTDILLFSVYAILSGDPSQVSGFNWFVYQAAPFVLIFVPVCYLVAVLATLLFRRLWCWAGVLRRRLTRCWGSESTVEGQNNPTNSVVSVFRDTGSSATSEASQATPLTDSFFRDEGEREPLLADVRVGGTESEGVYSTEGLPESQSFTHNTIELLPSQVKQ